jgi:hypothetical protein
MPVGIFESAYALLTKGFNPCFQASIPPALNKPHLITSRREICPCDSAFKISRRFFRAFSASRNRIPDDFLDRNMDIPPPVFKLLRAAK